MMARQNDKGTGRNEDGGRNEDEDSINDKTCSDEEEVDDNDDVSDNDGKDGVFGSWNLQESIDHDAYFLVPPSGIVRVCRNSANVPPLSSRLQPLNLQYPPSLQPRFGNSSDREDPESSTLFQFPPSLLIPSITAKATTTDKFEDRFMPIKTDIPEMDECTYEANDYDDDDDDDVTPFHGMLHDEQSYDADDDYDSATSNHSDSKDLFVPFKETDLDILHAKNNTSIILSWINEIWKNLTFECCLPSHTTGRVSATEQNNTLYVSFSDPNLLSEVSKQIFEPESNQQSQRQRLPIKFRKSANLVRSEVVEWVEWDDNIDNTFMMDDTISLPDELLLPEL